MKPFDLHIHSYMSDGTYSPADIPALAKAQGVELIALTDHDTAAGCREAAEAGRSIGVKVICGMEIDAEFTSELHILGLGIDPEHEKVLQYQAWRREGRIERNRKILHKLKLMGIDIEDIMEHSHGNDTRLHIAKGIIAGGYAKDIAEAFERYIGSGAPAYVPGERISKREAIELCGAAGGVSVLAHPCKLKADPNKMLKELSNYGLWGLEAYYPITTPGQLRQLLLLGKRYGLVPTCGSDFHGKNRDISIGAAFADTPGLERAYEHFEGRTPGL